MSSIERHSSKNIFSVSVKMTSKMLFSYFTGRFYLILSKTRNKFKIVSKPLDQLDYVDFSKAALLAVAS